MEIPFDNFSMDLARFVMFCLQRAGGIILSLNYLELSTWDSKKIILPKVVFEPIKIYNIKSIIF